MGCWIVIENIRRVLFQIPTTKQEKYNVTVLSAHVSHWLKVSYCDSWMCVVRRQQFLQRTSSLKLPAGFVPNLTEMFLILPSLKIVHIDPVRRISRPHGLKIDFRDEHFKKSFGLTPQGLEP